MTTEQKQILLKDLCGRLFYNPYILVEGERNTILTSITIYRDEYAEIWYEGTYYDIEDVKPYLRPMSSMTKEEKEEMAKMSTLISSITLVKELGDWLNSHHFDYRGLISMGLALEAPEDMYKIE